MKTPPQEELRDHRDAIETLVDQLEWWMVGFTAVVVAGLVIEWEKPNFSLFQLHDFGGLLVTIGVAGELGMAFVAQMKARRLRSINADIDRNAQRENAALQLEAAKLRRHIAGREISDDQIAVIKSKLSSFGSQLAHIAVAVDGLEAKRFSGHLWLSLNECAWDVWACGDRPPDKFPLPGLMIFAKPDDRAQEVSRATCAVLKEIGIRCTLFRDFVAPQRDSNPQTGQRYWPEYFWQADNSAVLLVVNEAPLMDEW